MEAIVKEATEDTPQVCLDKQNGKFEMSGKSLPEDVTEFYDPILEWLESYAENPNEMTEFVFKMDYFNTASSKMILDVLLKLEDMSEGGHSVKVKWMFREGDEDMEEAGEEFEDIVEVEFEMGSFN
ncbi:MAG: DUF1987 domain-containing protein [Flavobacteriales bacterium]|nr:DUF1987 domain-containing protein [Flavobacteriales bacterium]